VERIVIRLRQVAMIAPDLDPVVDELRRTFGLQVCFHDPGVAEFGLRNALLLVGDQFIEVLSPIREGTTVQRLLDKRGGAGGYMAIFEVDDLDRRVEHLTANGVRIVWSGDLDDIRGRHLHPSDVGGTLVSIDQPVPAGSWRWGGPDWEASAAELTADATVSAIAGATVSADDGDALRDRWELLGLAAGIEFVDAGPRGPGLDGVDLVVVDRARVGERVEIGGVRFTLV
jgi:catechol 2,3-dioxygenase-like lactoylglutathione lyase family enzyme